MRRELLVCAAWLIGCGSTSSSTDGANPPPQHVPGGANGDVDGGAGANGGANGGDGSGAGGGGASGGACTAAIDASDVRPAPGCWSVSTTYAGQGPSGTRRAAPEAKGRMPTNRWWSSLAWNLRGDNAWSQAMYPHPLAVRAFSGGLSIAYVSTPSISSDGRTYTFQLPSDPAGPRGDVAIGVDGMSAPASEVAGFSDWTVTARLEDGAKELRATIGKGMPFVYARVHGGAARLALRGDEQVQVIHDGDEALAFTVNGRAYAAFAPRGATWQRDANGFTSTLAGKDYVSLAALPDARPETLATFRAHAYAFVTDTKVAWCFDEASAALTTTFTTTTEAMEPGESDVPLLAVYPHQWRAMPAPFAAASASYASPRGEMKTLAAKGFTVARSFGGVLPSLPWLGADDARLRAYVGEVAIDPPALVTDTYGGGKQMAKLANAALIADQLGMTDRRDAMLGAVKAALTDWLTAKNDAPPLLRYLPDWGTVVGYPASFGSNTELNDHHFHWSYLVKAASVVALYDPAWAADAQLGGGVKMLARDASNPLRDDPELPFLRNFDVYEGHGWASGHANFADGNNQESSSESMHYATSLILWGEATHNRTLRDLGVFLYATEAAAIREYWLDATSDMPASFPHPNVGIVWGSGGAYGTWWTAEPEAIHGINFLPFHGGSLYLGASPDTLRANYAHMVQQIGGPEGTKSDPNAWQDVIWLAQSLFDPDAALAKFLAKADAYPIEAGETRAHTYHWLASMQALGRVDPSVTADTATYAVFRSGATATHVAYNASCAPRTIHFRDGVAIEAAPRTLVAARDGAAPRSWTLGSCAPQTGSPSDAKCP